MLAALLLIATLRQVFDAYDFSAGLCSKDTPVCAPADPEQRAWYIANLLHVDNPAGEKLAEEMRAAHPENAWSWFAIAQAYEGDLDHFDDNKLAAERLAGETNDDLVIARAMALSSIVEPDAALKVLEDQLPRARDRARVLVAKARMLQYRAQTQEQAIAAYNEALKLDPSNVGALSELGMMLRKLRRRDEAKPLTERAAQLSSYVMATQMPSAAALDELIRERAGDPYILSLAVRGFHQLKMEDRVCELQDRILREAPASPQALAVLMSRPRSRVMARDLLDYPYRTPESTAAASFILLRDEQNPPNDQELIALAHAIPVTVSHVTQLLFAAQKLADRKLDLDYAERVSREAVELNERDLLQLRFDSDSAMRDRTERAFRASVKDTIGWVLLARGEVNEAVKELTAARILFPESSTNAYHLGRAFEAQKMIAKAEQLYREGLSLQISGTNPNRAALEQLYRRRHKSLDGFEAYLKHVDSAGSASNREHVLATRIARPAAAPHFRLKSLDGRTVSLTDLKGKVAVMNFWGVWCGWCVKEMPDLAKLAKRYADDDRVRIVTVDTDDDPAVVRQWMSEHHYDFPVLIDDGWAHRSGVFAYPTTWFLDPQGRIAFKKEGWTEKLIDQFSWRIDVLKK